MPRDWKVSVIMSIHNTKKEYILQSIDSVKSQTFKDWELIIIDDGSEIPVSKLGIEENPRIRIYRNPQNEGLPAALNYALSIANGEYIARLDPDDIALEDRLQVQYDYMQKHKEIVLLGSAITLFNSNGIISTNIHPLKHEEIRVSMLFRNSFFHPTVMIRKSFLDSYDLRYDPRFRYAQDYELFDRVIDLGATANLTEPLVRFRIHDQSTTATKSAEQNKTKGLIWLRRLKQLGIAYPDLVSHELISSRRTAKSLLEKLKIKFWTKRIIRANSRKKVYDPTCLDNFLNKEYSIISRTNVK